MDRKRVTGEGQAMYAVTAPGLEQLAVTELEALGLRIGIEDSDVLIKEQAGGVSFEGTQEALYRANLYMRTASRILVRVGDFTAVAFTELRRKTKRIPWELYLKPGQPLAIRAAAHKSRLYHSGAIAERIAGAIGDRLGIATPLVKPEEDEDNGSMSQLILVRLVLDHCTISIDSSGALLHRRGYRQETAKAPLRETLAAAMLIASGWDRESPLLDPFCGSGTIPIEAALMAQHIPPGRSRHFAFMDWPSFDTQLWQNVLEDADGERVPVRGKILSSDRDAGAVEAAQRNAQRAGVLESVEFSHKAVSAIQPPGIRGWVVTNPPYGVRISQRKDLRNLYAQFGNVLREKCPGWRVAVLSNDPMLLGQTRLRFIKEVPLMNGGVRVKLSVGDVPVGGRK